ncbi:hypothetical protein RUM43_006626 [Polyplax serrata]|uniref:PHD-type domain-containing protein n=1 Tax=Polyplax serrata TaxID=468196 RepID=A0AAN8PCY8_POLSC
MKRSFESLKELTKITEEEEKYWNEDFNVSVMRNQNFVLSMLYVFSKLHEQFKCTICNKNLWLEIQPKEKLFIHPILLVLMCQDCCEFYGDGDFALDEDGTDKYCRWCGDGGRLIMCSTCIYAFCDNCIRKNFGVSTLEKIIADDNWECYFCDLRPLWYLRSVCRMAKDLNAKTEEKRKDSVVRKQIMDASDSVDRGEAANKINETIEIESTDDEGL